MWFYLRDARAPDEKTGPIADPEFLRLAYENEIKPDTLVMHATHTKGQWVAAETVSAYRARQQQAADDRKRRQEQDEREQRMRGETEDEPSQDPVANTVDPHETTVPHGDRWAAAAGTPAAPSKTAQPSRKRRCGCVMAVIVSLITAIIFTCSGCPLFI